MTRGRARTLLAGLAIALPAAAACMDVGDSTAVPCDDAGGDHTMEDGALETGDGPTSAEASGADAVGSSDSASFDSTLGDASDETPSDEEAGDGPGTETGGNQESGGPEAGGVESGPDAPAETSSGMESGPDGPNETSTGLDATSEDAGHIVESGAPDSTVDDAPSEGSSTSDASDGGGGIVPCTSSGQTGCVPCAGNASGVCTPTEAVFVQFDINQGLATLDGGDSTQSGCYSCLWNASCLDDTVFGDSNHECGDLTGTFDGGSSVQECLATVGCILATSCVDSAGVSTCYCGTSHEGSACASAGGAVNGACLTQEVDGLGFPASDNTDILKNYTDTTRPSGMANEIFQCSLSNGCSSCTP